MFTTGQIRPKVAGRGALYCVHLPALLLAAHVRLRRTRLPGQRRLHGSRQLGHRPGRRRALRLPAALGAGHVQFHGHPAADAERAARHRLRPRPGPGLPRNLSARHDLRALGAGRDRHRRLRPGRGAGRRHRAQPALPYPAADRRADHRRRHAAHSRPAELRHPHAGSFHPQPDRADRRLLPHRDPAGQAVRRGDDHRPDPAPESRQPLCRDRHPRAPP